LTTRQKLAFERDGNEKALSSASAEQGFFFAEAPPLRIMKISSLRYKEKAVGPASAGFAFFANTLSEDHKIILP
jgi:hypothetical protein